MKKISHCLFFASQAEEAARFYTSLFPDGKIGKIARYGKEGFEAHGQPEGKVMTVQFEIAGTSYMALNGAPPSIKFNEAYSIVVTCDTQAEVDELWDRLTREGSEVACGWATDKFGVRWQVVPKGFVELVTDPDPKVAGKAMKAMLQMKKLDVNALRKAVNG
jgi:predicted 3-demethylubiquinone-9 3-methyltransferase (glyoxalase superfamily)